MNRLGFQVDTKITEFLKQKSFTLSAEIIPPRNGTEQAKVLDLVQSLIQSGAQFLSVTKGAGGSLRGGSLPIAQTIKDNFKVPCIAHFTCRDLTPQEIENQLVDHHYFGVRNILALRGDPPVGQPEWDAKEGSYHYAYELIEQIKKLNNGIYLPRDGGPQADEQLKLDFCIGCAVYPEHPNPQERIDFLKRKVDAGAEYAITQMIFDPNVYEDLLNDCAKSGISIPILPGTRLLKSKKQALRMQSRFNVSVPQSYLEALPDDPASPQSKEEACELFLSFVDQLRKLGAPGLHLFVLSDKTGACTVLTNLAD